MRSPLAWPCAWALALPGRGSWSRCGDLCPASPHVHPSGFGFLPARWSQRGLQCRLPGEGVGALEGV